MKPEHKVEKIYQVTTANPICHECIDAFILFMYFPYEDITTKPVELNIKSEYTAELRLIEGKYHQIKRMFGRYRNPVLEIHRSAIGEIHLDPMLQVGESRSLSDTEVGSI